MIGPIKTQFTSVNLGNQTSLQTNTDQQGDSNSSNQNGASNKQTNYKTARSPAKSVQKSTQQVQDVARKQKDFINELIAKQRLSDQQIDQLQHQILVLQSQNSVQNETIDKQNRIILELRKQMLKFAEEFQELKHKQEAAVFNIKEAKDRHIAILEQGGQNGLFKILELETKIEEQNRFIQEFQFKESEISNQNNKYREIMTALTSPETVSRATALSVPIKLQLFLNSQKIVSEINLTDHSLLDAVAAVSLDRDRTVGRQSAVLCKLAAELANLSQQMNIFSAIFEERMKRFQTV